MKHVSALVCLFFVAFTLADIPLRICSFNIENFGPTKAGRSSVMDVITAIMDRYDVTFIQELSDAPDGTCGVDTGPAICTLMDKLNNISSYTYKMEISQRVGGSGPEQYVFVYRESVVEVVTSFIYNGSAAKYIERPPFVVEFKPVGSQGNSFVGITIHTRPSHAVEEIYNLTVVARDVYEAINSDMMFMLGDFNADGTVFDEDTEWPFFFDELYSISIGNWTELIKNGVDTTVAVSNNTYDRFVVSESLANYVNESSPIAFYFNDESVGGYSMDPILTQGCDEGWITDCGNELVAADRVSDHYPVEAQFIYTTGAGRATKCVDTVILSIFSFILLMLL